MKKKKPVFKIEGCFSVRVTNVKAKKALMHSIKHDTVHARNMVLILRNQLYVSQQENEQMRQVYQAFTNDRVLRDTVYGRKGSKSAELIALLRQHFTGNAIFEQLCLHCQRQLDSKSFNSVLVGIASSYNQFFTNIKSYTANKAAYALTSGNQGVPRPPRPKAVASLSQASLSLDREKWRLLDKVMDKKCKTSHPYLRIKCAHKHPVWVPVNWHKFPVPAGKTLRSLNINISNDAVYLNFTYGHEVKATDKQTLPQQDAPDQKWAAADVGMINLLALLVDDTATPSLLICGNRFKHYNKQFNKHKSKLDEAIANEATEFKTVTREDDEIQIAIAHSDIGEALKRKRTHLIEVRNRYFKSEFDKVSRRVTEYLLRANVTDFVISKNLSFLKNAKENVTLNRKTKQSFYHLPFGTLLNAIERKCQLVGITVHSIDEAYSSKVSCFSGDIREAKSLRLQKGQSLSTTDCQGSRVKRGLYKDVCSGLLFNADINGAINHIKIACSEYDPRYLLQHKHKLCNPKRIKSDHSFCRLRPATRVSNQYQRVRNESINQPSDQV